MEQMAQFRFSVWFESTLGFCLPLGAFLALVGWRKAHPEYADYGFWIASAAYVIWSGRIMLDGLGNSSGSSRDVAIMWRAGAVLAVGFGLSIALRVVFADRDLAQADAFCLSVLANALIQIVLLFVAGFTVSALRRETEQASPKTSA
jgi:hypothetical protein